MAAPPRLYEEVLKLLLLGEGEKSYQLLRRTGLFEALFSRFSDWLDRETDGFPHARVGQALDWVDRRVQQGDKVSPQLLFAVMFGQYLEEKAEGLRESGAHLQQAIDQAVAEFLEDLSPTVQIHGKVGGLIRHILGYQQRFGKTPGRHPASFIKRPAFGDALEYLGFAGELTREEVCDWWREYVRKNPLAPAAETSGAETAEPQVKGKRKRPRRRRRKKADV
jgi:poly(A) polymerase